MHCRMFIPGACFCLVQLTLSSGYSMSKRSFDCSSPVSGLTQADCQHMSDIGMAGQGYNSYTDNGQIWIGNDGPNTFTFQNLGGGVPVTIIIWNNPPNDYQSSFVNVRLPQISYSLGDTESVNISVANDVSGGWAGLYNELTTLSQYGQINNTWGEFTTGNYATVDVSREINMAGNGMSINLDSGCISNLDTCSFQCPSGNTCGESGTYTLVNCDPGSQPGATYGTDANGNPSGGCQGFTNGGHMNVTFYDH